MAYCPNCAAELEATVETCHQCGAIFGERDGWNPVKEKPPDSGGRIAREEAKPIADERPRLASRPASRVSGFTSFLSVLLGTILVLGFVPLIVIALIREFGTKTDGTEYGLIGAVVLAAYALVFIGIPLAIVFLVRMIFSSSAGPLDEKPGAKSQDRLHMGKPPASDGANGSHVYERDS